MAAVKGSNIAIETFDGPGDFTLWQQWVKILLTREGTFKTLKTKARRTVEMTDANWMARREKDKPEKMSKEEWEDLKDMALATSTLEYLESKTIGKLLEYVSSQFMEYSCTEKMVVDDCACNFFPFVLQGLGNPLDN